MESGMSSSSKGTSIVIQEPSMEDATRRRKREEDESLHEKKKCVVQHVGEQPFLLEVFLISAKTINGFSPMPDKNHYVLAWAEKNRYLKTTPCVIPFAKHAVYRTVVDPGMKYLHLELLHDNGAEDDPESSQRRTLVGMARLQLHKYRNEMRGRRRERVLERLVHVSSVGEDGVFRFEERWEVLMEISTREAALIRPTNYLLPPILDY
ncbi:hypothetical protein ACLOJK_024575 [Asimina triloba]